MQQKQACDLPESQEFVGGIEAFEEYEESQMCMVKGKRSLSLRSMILLLQKNNQGMLHAKMYFHNRKT